MFELKRSETMSQEPASAKLAAKPADISRTTEMQSPITGEITMKAIRLTSALLVLFGSLLVSQHAWAQAYPNPYGRVVYAPSMTQLADGRLVMYLYHTEASELQQKGYWEMRFHFQHGQWYCKTRVLERYIDAKRLSNGYVAYGYLLGPESNWMPWPRSPRPDPPSPRRDPTPTSGAQLSGEYTDWGKRHWVFRDPGNGTITGNSKCRHKISFKGTKTGDRVDFYFWYNHLNYTAWGRVSDEGRKLVFSFEGKDANGNVKDSGSVSMDRKR